MRWTNTRDWPPAGHILIPRHDLLRNVLGRSKGPDQPNTQPNLVPLLCPLLPRSFPSPSLCPSIFLMSDADRQLFIDAIHSQLDNAISYNLYTGLAYGACKPVDALWLPPPSPPRA
jgi:hypothetical protein